PGRPAFLDPGHPAFPHPGHPAFPHPGHPAFPRPRRPLEARADDDSVRRWYERGLGWATAATTAAAESVGGGPVELPIGTEFDVLEMPADAGFAVLRRVPRTGPVALHGQSMRMLVAPGTAERLPELLDWLEWGGIALDLVALGPGDRMPAPLPTGSREAADGRTWPVWLRPPEPGCEVEPALPAVTLGGGSRGGGDTGAPDLVRIVGTAATECHRARLLRAASAQPFAFSYASRTVAGTRPRSLTS
ncbi:SCO3374 family protein, partial [Streptomyces sp. 8N706]|uniref:SCO3374 family protein n=1 Tax=Streptomyces sp. 8N706 TaxID=3457416 RepID=UPI003FD04BF9